MNIGKVKIGKTEYPIILVKEIRHKNIIQRVFSRKTRVGEIFRNKLNKNENYIQIAEDTRGVSKRQIYYHEIAHGLMYEVANNKDLRFIALRLSENEQFIERLAKVLKETFILKKLKMNKKQKEGFGEIPIYSMDNHKLKGGL